MGENINISTPDFVKEDTHWGCFGVGEKVFAYWKGRTSFSTGYYSGTITKKGVLNTYIIHFDDDTTSNTSEVQILPIRVLGVGTKVYYLPDESLQGPISAQVVGHQLAESGCETDAKYAITCFGSPNVEICERRQLYLAPTQAKELRRKYEAVQPKFGDVNLDNVVDGPRRRSRVSESAFSSESTSTSPKSPRTLNKTKKISPGNAAKRKSTAKRKSSTTSDNDSADEPMPKLTMQSVRVSQPVTHSLSANVKGANPKVQTRIVQVDQSARGRDQKSGILIEGKRYSLEKSSLASDIQSAQKPKETIITHSTPNQIQPQEEKSQVLNSQQKPAIVSNNSDITKGVEMKPTKSSLGGTLFKGYFFFLTSGDRELIKGMGVGNYCKDITKTDMQKMISKQGGRELLSVGDEKNKPFDRLFLLASSHLRTLKYLYCIASGIPCVAQRWILDCVEKNEVVDWNPYRLSPGWSVTDMCLIPFHNNYPLENMRIGLATFKAETIDTWQKLVPAAKGHIFISKAFHYDRQPAELKVPADWLDGKIDILVSDFHCPLPTLELLKGKGIPLVKIEWLVQTIIMGKKADLRVGEVPNNHVAEKAS